MSLTSSMYSGISGMSSLGNAMQVIGDNIANVNTLAFKSSSFSFQDLLSQSIATQAGTSQVGRGTSLETIQASFSQGSFESTGNTTDLAISGEGFFKLATPSSTDSSYYYSRAGNFSFDNDGNLVNPQEYVVRGIALDADGNDKGAETNIKLDSFSASPKATDKMTVVTNLNADSTSKSVVLSNSWNGKETTNISSTSYEYQTLLKVYDSIGSTHDVTVYYDKQSGSRWDYIVTCDTSEDKRNLAYGTEGLGLLARGTITFSESSGKISTMTMDKFTGMIGDVTPTGANLKQKDINFAIDNYDPFTKDGYDMKLTYGGSEWTITDLPTPKSSAYPSAKINSSSSNKIEINIDGDTANTTDLTITIATTSTPETTDTLVFDILKPTGIQDQNFTNLVYTGDTGNENTTLVINEPNKLTTDQTNNRVVFDAEAKEWYWSMPAQQNIMNATTANLSPAGLTETTSVTTGQEDTMIYRVDDAKIRWDNNAAAWNWEAANAKTITPDTSDYSGGITSTNTSYSVSNETDMDRYSTGNKLRYVTATGITDKVYTGTEITSTNTTMKINTIASFTNDCTIDYYQLNYTQATNTWAWEPGHAPNATNFDYPSTAGTFSTGSTYDKQLLIDFGGGANDLQIDFTSALTAATPTGSIKFNINETKSTENWAWNMPIVDFIAPAGITESQIKVDIAQPDNVTINTANNGGPIALSYVAATETWTVATPQAGYTIAATTGKQDKNGIWLSLKGSAAVADADIKIDFNTPLTADIPVATPFTFNTYNDGSNKPPLEYESAEIISTSDDDSLNIGLKNATTTNIAYSFATSIKADGTLGFDIDTHIPPTEYSSAKIASTSDNDTLALDFNGDATTDVTFAFTPTTGVTGNGYFQFDIDPNVAPTEYAKAKLYGDKDKLEIDLDATGDKDDVKFTFKTALSTGATATDSVIKFDIEGTTAWESLSTGTDGYFQFTGDFLGGAAGTTEMDINFDIGAKYTGSVFVNDVNSTTQYAKSSTTTFQSADGYGAGDLQGVDVDTEGRITGIYSNGQLIPLYRVQLSTFRNKEGLLKLGGNLYRETLDSGSSTPGDPGTGGRGTISANSLEQSNVDVAAQFVKMITTQRGYQANSKIVTTIDQMLGETIAMKR